MLLLLACAHPPLPVADPSSAPLRRVEIIAGEPWLVGAELTPDAGPWTAARLDGFITAWVGPTAAHLDDAPVGSRWTVGDRTCEVDHHGAVAVAYVDLGDSDPLPEEPQCGAPRVWAHLRCDGPTSSPYAAPVGQPDVRVATLAGPVDHPAAEAVVRALPDWAEHQAVTTAAADQEAGAEAPERTQPGAPAITESLTVTRWTLDGASWLVVDGQMSWGEGDTRCGGEGGTEQVLAILSDSAEPRVLSRSWRSEPVAVLSLVRVGDTPVLSLARDGAEFLGTETTPPVYEVAVCVCMC